LSAAALSTDVQYIVEDLVIHTSKHLSHEKREMRQTGHPLYAWHRRQHHMARSRIRVAETRIRRGDRDCAVELLGFLTAWLTDHFRLADRMLGAYLRNRQRELAWYLCDSRAAGPSARSKLPLASRPRKPPARHRERRRKRMRGNPGRRASGSRLSAALSAPYGPRARPRPTAHGAPLGRKRVSWGGGLGGAD
jgi:hemerythrin-like metal-binding protein